MKQPQTSQDAWNSQTKEKLSNDHARIIEALKTIGKGNYETIANVAKMDRIAVGRRLKECEGLGHIYKTGSKSLLRSNRYGFDYCLTHPEKIDLVLVPIQKAIYSLPTLF